MSLLVCSAGRIAAHLSHSPAMLQGFAGLTQLSSRMARMGIIGSQTPLMLYASSHRTMSSSSNININTDNNATAMEIDKNLTAEYAPEIADVLKQREEKAKRKQSMMGVITSTKNKKTITVLVQYDKEYPKYNAVLSRRRKFMAHDEEERGNVGDLVRIVPCRPMSARKRHALIDIIRKAPV
jgi:small subunit ribosomal protein S17